jgi:hypothetical protein
VLNQVPRHEDVSIIEPTTIPRKRIGGGGIAPRVLNFRARWR